MSAETGSRLALALSYWERGWNVVPLKPAGKEALVEWRKYQSQRASRAEIEAWWQNNPDANVGVVTGAISNLVVVDVDPGADPAWVAANLPATLTAVTGRGGRHHYYSHPGLDEDGNGLPNAVGLVPKVDVRADGGLVVAPGSIHENGMLYVWQETKSTSLPAWATGGADTPVTLPLLPAGIRKTLGERRQGPVAPEEWGREVPAGERNVTVARLSGKLLSLGIAQTDVLSMMRGWVREHVAKGGEPFTDAELERTVASIAKREAAKRLATGAATGAATAEGEPRYILHSAATALEKEEPMDWLVKDLLPAIGSVVMYGDPGSKKTWVALHLAVATATGQHWLGRATKQGTALILDEESGNHRMRRRLGRVMRGLGAGPETPLFYTSLEGFLPGDPNDYEHLNELFGAVGPALVVVDALSDVMLGDENTVKDVRPLLLALRRLAEEHHCLVLTIHHTNKMGGYRGSSAIKANVDLFVRVTSKENEPEVAFQTEKTRDSEPCRFTALATWVGSEGQEAEQEARFLLEGGEVVEGPVGGGGQGLAPSRQFVFDLLTERGELTSGEIRDAGESQFAAETLRNAVKGLCREGLVENVGTSSRASYRLRERLGPKLW